MPVTKVVRSCSIKIIIAAMGVVLLIAASAPARAGLGGNAASIDADMAALRGAASNPLAESASAPSSYDVRSFASGDGVTVREYAAHSGPVFGVAWQGRRPPDLRVLLGSYYSEYSAANAAKGHVDLHHSMTKGPNSIVVMGGRMGHIVGRAYVPSLAPAGVDPKAVVK